MHFVKKKTKWQEEIGDISSDDQFCSLHFHRAVFSFSASSLCDMIRETEKELVIVAKEHILSFLLL